MTPKRLPVSQNSLFETVCRNLFDIFKVAFSLMQVFSRGFVVTAMTKVLPLPFCVAVSSFGFAALHLSPNSVLPLLLLGTGADVVYLRSGANLLAPYLLHALWNTSQVLAIALQGKVSFV